MSESPKSMASLTGVRNFVGTKVLCQRIKRGDNIDYLTKSDTQGHIGEQVGLQKGGHNMLDSTRNRTIRTLRVNFSFARSLSGAVC